MRAWQAEQPPDALPDAKRELSRLITNAALSIAKELPTKLTGATLRDLTISLGILVEKVVLLDAAHNGHHEATTGVVAILLPDNGRLQSNDKPVSSEPL